MKGGSGLSRWLAECLAQVHFTLNSQHPAPSNHPNRHHPSPRQQVKVTDSPASGYGGDWAVRLRVTEAAGAAPRGEGAGPRQLCVLLYVLDSRLADADMEALPNGKKKRLRKVRRCVSCCILKFGIGACGRLRFAALSWKNKTRQLTTRHCNLQGVTLATGTHPVTGDWSIHLKPGPSEPSDAPSPAAAAR